MNVLGKIYNWVYNKLCLWYRHVLCGGDLRIEGRILFQGRGNIEIGDHVTIYSRYSVNPIGGDRTVFQVMEGASLKIGSGVGMSHVVITAYESVTIEDNVMLGANCKIFDTDFHSLDYEERIHNGDRDVKTSPVRIKRGAFIGTQTLILKGVTIGEKSIIGAGSVVTKDVPDGEIWAGNPARFIKQL